MKQSNSGALRYAILRKEAEWGSYDEDGDDVYLPIYDDGSKVEPENSWLSQPHVVGVRGDTHVALIARDFRGGLQVGFWPELAGMLLDWAALVDEGYDLSSYSLTIVDPGVQAMRFYGLRVNAATIRVSEGQPTALADLDLIGKYGERLDDEDVPDLPSYPADISYVLQSGALLLDAGGGDGYEDRATFRSCELRLANNLTPGRHVRDVDPLKDKTIANLRTGTQRVSGSIEVDHTGPELTDAVLGALEGNLELLFAHPKGSVLTVGVAGAAAGSAVAIPVTSNPTTGPAFAAGEIVFLETEPNDPDQRSAAKVTSVGTGPDVVTVETLDRPVADGDKVYGMGLRIRAAGLKVSKATGSGGKESQRNQKYDFRTSDDGTGVQFSYLAGAAS